VTDSLSLNSQENKTDILSLSFEELSEALSQMGMPKFRTKQIWSWLHSSMAESFEEMTNISKADRQRLGENFVLYGCAVERRQISKQDETTKYLFRLNDGEFVESVLMKYKYGWTICVSSQVGCKMGCKFCASTLGGVVRSLRASEILAQVYAASRDKGIRVSHIVMMGMGEPLDNYDNVLRFLKLITDENGQNISMRHISLSTCGVVPGIYRLMEEKLQLTLSVSLHAPDDEIRSAMMPVNKKWNIEKLMKACRDYTDATSRRISFEYALVRGQNDTPECAMKLSQLLKGMLCHINLIPVNEVAETGCRESYPQSVKAFAQILEKNGFAVTVRRKLGADIDAACGQLRKNTRKSNGGDLS